MPGRAGQQQVCARYQQGNKPNTPESTPVGASGVPPEEWQDVLNRLRGLEGDVQSLKGDMARTTVTNTAAQIAHHATDRPFRPTGNPTQKFYMLLEDPTAKGCFEELGVRTGVPPEAIAGRLTNTVTFRNADLHPASFAQLELQAEEALRFIERYGDLRQTYPDACWVVENFHSIRSAFEPV